jgi:hypothetical protein
MASASRQRRARQSIPIGKRLKRVEQPAQLCEQLSMVAQETAQNLWNGSDKLVEQAQKQILAKVLPQQQGTFLGA